MLPKASLREQSHTERRFASPRRIGSNIITAPRFTAKASAPISPIGAASGGSGEMSFAIAIARMNAPIASIAALFTSAARVRMCAARPMAQSVTP